MIASILFGVAWIAGSLAIYYYLDITTKDMPRVDPR